MSPTPHRPELAALLLLTALLASACGLFGGGDDKGDADKDQPPQANADKPDDAPKADAPRDDAPKTLDKPRTIPGIKDKGLAKPSPLLKKTDIAPKGEPAADPGKEPPSIATPTPKDDAPKDPTPKDPAPQPEPPTDPLAKEPADAPADAATKAPARELLDLNNALTSALIKQSTGYSAAMRPAPLQGIEPGPDYNVAHMQPGTRQNFGVSLQVWREPNPGSQSRRFNDLLRQYPDAKRGRALGDSSFTASWDNLRYLIWLDRKKRYIAAITCDARVCASDDKASALARKLAERLPDY